MKNRVAHLKAFTEVVTASQPQLFEQAVKAAYAAGARHSDLLTAVDIARALVAVPPRVVASARRVVNNWQWMEFAPSSAQSSTANLQLGQ